MMFWWEPVLQLTQLDCPGLAWKVPTGHATQSAEVDDPETVAEVPAAQLEQDGAPPKL